MSDQLKVLLLENVANVGHTGQIVSVSAGFARNFLFPQGKAALASESIQVEYKKKAAHKKAEEQRILAQTRLVAEKFNNTELTLKAKVKEASEIYGKITPKDIAKELSVHIGQSLKAKAIELHKPITALGDYTVTVYLLPDVSFSLHVNVVSDEQK